MRLGPVAAAVCMVLVAASTGLVLYLGLGLSIGAAVALSVAMLAAMALYGLQSAGSGESRSLAGRLHELSRSNAELALQIVELSRRVDALEGKTGRPTEPVRSAHELPATPAADIANRLRPSLTPPLPPATNLPEPSALPALRDRPTLIPPAAPTESPQPTFKSRSPIAAPPEPVARAESNLRAEPGLRTEPTLRTEPSLRAEPTLRAEPGSRETSLRTDTKLLPTLRTEPGTSIIATVRDAIAADRIDLYLQPIVTLPGRETRYYEALARLRTEDGKILQPSEIIPWAEPAGLMPMIDYAIVFRCIQMARRLQLKDRRIGLFCNLSGSTLYDRGAFQQLIELLAGNSTLASLIVLELGQSTLRTAGPRENESIAALAGRGFRFSLDHVTDLRFDPRDLAERGFRFVKVSAARLLDRTRTDEGFSFTELSDALGLAGIDLIAEKIEADSTVASLLDCDVRYGQGYLFSPPRQVLTEALQRVPDRVERVTGSDGAAGFAAPASRTDAADGTPDGEPDTEPSGDEPSRLHPRI